MLLRREVLEGIESGEIDLVFRRWKRPTVKTGGRLRTTLGELEIRSVTIIDLGELDERDVIRSGFDSLGELKRALRERGSGSVYRVEIGGIRPDPRIGLRSKADFDGSEMDAISEQLDAFDARSKSGSWTREYLRLIGDNPHVPAETLSSSAGVEKHLFKGRVRRLKELGLTISHSPGYELSPRGEEFRRRLGI